MENNGTVLLFNVGPKSTYGYAPMAMLSIANFLIKGGFKAKVIDTRILSDDEINKELDQNSLIIFIIIIIN